MSFWRSSEQIQAQSSPVHDGDCIHNNVFFEDMIWSPVAFPWCFEYNSLHIQNCPLGQCLQRPTQQIPNHWKACQLSAHTNQWMILPPFCQIWPQRSLHVSHCLLHLIPTRVVHILWSQFLHGLTDDCLFFEWHPTKPLSSSNCFASVVGLSGCHYHMRAVTSPRILGRNDKSVILDFSPLAIGLFRFSGLRKSLFRLK